MIDISMQGARLVFENSFLKGNVVIDFSDEGTPIDFPDLEVCGYAMTMNGELVTWTKPTPITFTVTVIPGSDSDQALRRLLYAGHVGGKRGNPIETSSVIITSATLETPAVYTNGVINSAGRQVFTFSNGRMYGGNPAISSNAEGKMSARSYRFVFESVATK